MAASVNIGGVSFNGATSINLPGVNTSGNQNTSGNAATATKAYVTESNTDTINRGLVFCDAANNASGNKDLKYDRNLTYNANSNTLVTDTFQGNTVNVGEIILGGSNGSNGQYIRSTGSGAQWENFPSLFDGNYNSLSNKPTIPTNNNQLTNGAGYLTSSSFITSVRRVREVANGSEASRGNGSTSYATHISTTFTSVPSDSRFLIFVNFQIRSSSSDNNRKCEARVSVSGGGLLNSFTKSTALNSYTEDNKFHFMEFDTSSNTSNRTYSLQYRSNHTNEGCSIRSASLVVIEFKPN